MSNVRCAAAVFRPSQPGEQVLGRCLRRGTYRSRGGHYWCWQHALMIQGALKTVK